MEDDAIARYVQGGANRLATGIRAHRRSDAKPISSPTVNSFERSISSRGRSILSRVKRQGPRLIIQNFLNRQQSAKERTYTIVVRRQASHLQVRDVIQKPSQCQTPDRLYCRRSLFKQATEGDRPSARPGLFDVLGRAKWSVH